VTGKACHPSFLYKKVSNFLKIRGKNEKNKHNIIDRISGGILKLDGIC
jgi:hypothetical protein